VLCCAIPFSSFKKLISCNCCTNCKRWFLNWKKWILFAWIITFVNHDIVYRSSWRQALPTWSSWSSTCYYGTGHISHDDQLKNYSSYSLKWNFFSVSHCFVHSFLSHIAGGGTSQAHRSNMLHRVQLKNSAGRFLIVPCWCFPWLCSCQCIF
jgi:hypothetical protein